MLRVSSGPIFQPSVVHGNAGAYSCPVAASLPASPPAVPAVPTMSLAPIPHALRALPIMTSTPKRMPAKPQGLTIAASALCFAGCDIAGPAPTILLWTGFILSLIGTVKWDQVRKNLINSVPERFRDGMRDYINAIALPGLHIIVSGVAGFAFLRGIGMKGSEQVFMQSVGLVLAAMSHVMLTHPLVQSRRHAHRINTVVPDLEYKISNAEDPVTQLNTLKEAVSHGDGHYLFRTEAYEDPHRFSHIMTGENGILLSQPFVDASVKTKLKILDFYQEQVMQEADVDVVNSYLKALEHLLTHDTALTQKASPLIQQLIRYRDVYQNPSENLVRKTDHVNHLLCLMATYRSLFRMHSQDIPAVKAALTNHAPELALLFETNQTNPEVEARLMDLLERQILDKASATEMSPANSLSIALAAPGADLDTIFTESLPRLGSLERSSVVLTAIRMVVGRRDAESLRRLLIECEMHVETSSVLQVHATDVERILLSSRDSGIETWDQAVGDFIDKVRSHTGESTTTEDQGSTPARARQTVAARLQRVRSA